MTENNYQHTIQWYPGHMTRTFRALEATLSSIDAAIILLDARIPYSSMNPELLKLLEAKPKLFLLNKSDLADGKTTDKWVSKLTREDMVAVSISSKNQNAEKLVLTSLDRVTRELREKRIAKGITGLRPSVLVCGIPNVGKSTLVNLLCKSARAKVADRPGVTRGLQRITLDTYDLVDVPGLLWPKFESRQVACNLAFIGSINDDILGREELASELLTQLTTTNFPSLSARFKLPESASELRSYELLEEIGRKRGMLIRGGEVDIERAAIMVIDEFRDAKFGRISLETPV